MRPSGIIEIELALADPGGAAGVCPPPTGSIYFVFACVFAEKCMHRRLAPPSPNGSATPPTGNPGSATDWDRNWYKDHKQSLITRSFRPRVVHGVYKQTLIPLVKHAHYKGQALLLSHLIGQAGTWMDKMCLSSVMWQEWQKSVTFSKLFLDHCIFTSLKRKDNYL